MGKILILAGSILCILGIGALAAAAKLFGRQREKLVNRINEEYKEEQK